MSLFFCKDCNNMAVGCTCPPAPPTVRLQELEARLQKSREWQEAWKRKARCLEQEAAMVMQENQALGRTNSTLHARVTALEEAVAEVGSEYPPHGPANEKQHIEAKAVLGCQRAVQALLDKLE